MDFSVIAGVVFVGSMLVFVLFYSRSNVNNRAQPVARESTSSSSADSSASDTSSTYDSGTSADTICADTSSSCDVSSGDGGSSGGD
jgi:hypothetical protein